MDWDSNWEAEAIAQMDKGGTPTDWEYDDLNIIYDSPEAVTNGHFAIFGCGCMEDMRNSKFGKPLEKLAESVRSELREPTKTLDVVALRKQEPLPPTVQLHSRVKVDKYTLQRPYILFCLDLLGVDETAQYRWVLNDTAILIHGHGGKYAIVMIVEV